MTTPIRNTGTPPVTWLSTEDLETYARISVRQITNTDYVLSCINETLPRTSSRLKVALCVYLREKIKHYKATRQEFAPLENSSKVELSKSKLRMLNSSLITNISPECKARLMATHQAAYLVDSQTSGLAESILIKFDHSSQHSRANLASQHSSSHAPAQTQPSMPPPPYNEAINYRRPLAREASTVQQATPNDSELPSYQQAISELNT